jgi:RNA polymerase sigma-70 factor (ECF subfamily)
MNKRFNALVDQHRHWVYTFAYYNLGNHEEAEDATQEVLIRLWNHLPELKTETIAAWLRRVTKNACIDSVRRRKAYTARVVPTGEDDVVQRAASNDPAPDVFVEASDLRGQIQEALAQIQEPYRSIVILREIQDLKYEEISECLNLPLNTIKSYLHRARRMLRDQLREAFNEAAG